MEEKIKVAIVSPGFLPVPSKSSGVELLIQAILDKNEIYKKLDIDLYTLESNTYKDYKFSNTNIIQIHKNKVWDFIFYNMNRIFLHFGHYFPFNEYQNGIKKRMKEFKKYDAIIVENNMLVCNLFKKYDNVVFRLHNDLVYPEKNKKLCRKILHNCNKFIVISDYLKESVLKVENSNKVIVLNNAIDMSKFDYKKLNPNLVKQYEKKYKNNNEIIFTYSGRIVDEKGVEEIVNSFNKLYDQFKNIKLLIVGNSILGDTHVNNYEKKIQALAKNNSNIIFTGTCTSDEMPYIYNVSDVILIPTKIPEAFGLVALESLAMGKKIISSDTGNLPFLIKNDGFIIKKENLQKELYDNMLYIMNNYESGNDKAKNGYIRVHNSKEFNIDEYYHNFCNIIENKDKT